MHRSLLGYDAPDARHYVLDRTSGVKIVVSSIRFEIAELEVKAAFGTK